MTTWNDFASDAPQLAETVRTRFDATGLALLATLRADGSPRLSGVEPFFWDGEVWIGMMPDSRKAADAVRDGRVALHAATIDKEMKAGDAKLGGRLLLVDDEARFREVQEAFKEATGYGPEGTYPLFALDLGEAVFVSLADEQVVIEWWQPGRGYQRVARS